MADSVEGREGVEALKALAAQYRSFAHRHPGLYDTFLPAPTPAEDPELAAALLEPVGVVASVLAAMNIEPQSIVPLVRALRASVHGFIDLELGRSFGLPDDIDESFTTTIGLVIDAIASRSNT
jgi:hypothetical protein